MLENKMLIDGYYPDYDTEINYDYEDWEEEEKCDE